MTPVLNRGDRSGEAADQRVGVAACGAPAPYFGPASFAERSSIAVW
jgi:hypothetical protein